MTRALGIRYLWADSICILQGTDDQARADWVIESSRMASVYGGAYITIAAAWGKSMHSGIFICRPSNMPAEATIGLGCLNDPTVKTVVALVPPGPGARVDSTQEPLFSCGLALQEGVLSRRVLICNRDQMVWQCQSAAFTESGEKMESLGSMRLDSSFETSIHPPSIARNLSRSKTASALATVFYQT